MVNDLYFYSYILLNIKKNPTELNKDSTKMFLYNVNYRNIRYSAFEDLNR